MYISNRTYTFCTLIFPMTPTIPIVLFSLVYTAMKCFYGALLIGISQMLDVHSSLGLSLQHHIAWQLHPPSSEASLYGKNNRN